MVKIIAVLGATGTQGGSVARKFAQIPGWEVRGITRNTESPAARKLAELGVKLIKGDLNDVDSLRSAFHGANAIFGVTDFWQFVQMPSTQKIAQEKGITWNEACYLQEVQHGKNIIDAAVEAAYEGQLERLVLSSLADAKKASKGKYTWVYHFDSKAHFVQYLEEQGKVSPHYHALLEKTSYVQIGNYLDNWTKNPIFTPKKEADGTVVFRYITPDISEHAKLYPTPFVHPPTDTGPFVEALVLKAPPKTTMLGTSTLLQYSDYVKLWGEIQGVPTKLQRLSLEDVVGMWPGGFGQEVGETIYYTREFGWGGGEGAILPEEAGVDKNDLTDVASYIKRTDWSSILKRGG